MKALCRGKTPLRVRLVQLTLETTRFVIKVFTVTDRFSPEAT